LIYKNNRYFDPTLGIWAKGAATCRAFRLAVFAEAKTAAYPHAAGGGTIVAAEEEGLAVAGHHRAGAVPGGDEWGGDRVWHGNIDTGTDAGGDLHRGAYIHPDAYAHPNAYTYAYTVRDALQKRRGVWSSICAGRLGRS
jgi:hypothetical protein